VVRRDFSRVQIFASHAALARQLLLFDFFHAFPGVLKETVCLEVQQSFHWGAVFLSLFLTRAVIAATRVRIPPAP